MNRLTQSIRIAANAASGMLAIVLMASGCQSAVPPKKSIVTKPQVTLVKPERRTLERTVGQPGYLYAYEQTSLYPKVSGFIEKWYVDIGDPLKSGQAICDIYVPELEAELRQKQAQLALQKENVQVAEQMVAVAVQYQAVAAAKTKEARANVGKFEAAVERAQSEFKRLTSLTGERVLDQQIMIEARKTLQSDVAANEAAAAGVEAAQATELARRADVAKAKIDVKAAQAKVLVDQADVERLQALVSYTHVTAPYDGVVVVRNANKGDYVKPATGDLSATTHSWDESTNRGAPIYVVASINKVRVYIDVPEAQASYVRVGTPARVVIPALNGEEISAPITRTSWALSTQSRTLRAELDLPNPDGRLRPGMYVYGEVFITRANVWTVPLECVEMVGNQNICYRADHGQAVLTPVQTGLNDGTWIEVVQMQTNNRWDRLTGTEVVIKGDLGELSNHQDIEVAGQAADKQPPNAH